MNAKVGEIVVALKEEIISSIHPKSIILSGSFGKGEVTVIEGKKGGLKFLSDCENELYLQLNEIEHTKTKARSPQANGVCERFHRTILNEFYRVIFRKKIYSDLEVLQTDPDEHINRYNHERTHQGKRCQSRTPMQTFIDGKQYFAQKNLDNLAA